MKKISMLVLMILATILFVPSVVKADDTASVSVVPNRSIKAGDEVTITVDYGKKASNMYFDAEIDCSLFKCTDIKKEDITIDGQAIKSNEKATNISVEGNSVKVSVLSTSNDAQFQTIEMKVIAAQDITTTTSINVTNIRSIPILQGTEASTSIVVPDPTKYTMSVDPVKEVKVGDTVTVTLKWDEPAYESYFDFSFLANLLEVGSYKAYDIDGNEVALTNSTPTPMEKAGTYGVSIIPTDGKQVQTVQLTFTVKSDSADAAKISVWNIANDVVLYLNKKGEGLPSEDLEIALVKTTGATSNENQPSSPESATQTNSPELTDLAAQTNTTEVANPKTADNVLSYVGLTLISMSTIAFCGYKVFRKVRN